MGLFRALRQIGGIVKEHIHESSGDTGEFESGNYVDDRMVYDCGICGRYCVVDPAFGKVRCRGCGNEDPSLFEPLAEMDEFEEGYYREHGELPRDTFDWSDDDDPSLYTADGKCPRCGGEMEYHDQGGIDNYFECPYCYCHVWEDVWDFEPVEDDIPEGCAACGGPYPNCMISCKLFDD